MLTILGVTLDSNTETVPLDLQTDATAPVTIDQSVPPSALHNTSVPDSLATAPVLSVSLPVQPSPVVAGSLSLASPTAPSATGLQPRAFDWSRYPGYTFLLGDPAVVLTAAQASAWLWETADQNGVYQVSVKPGGGAPTGILAVQPPANQGIEWRDMPGTGVPAWVQLKYVDGVKSDEARPNPARASGDPSTDMAIFEHFLTGGAADSQINVLAPANTSAQAQTARAAISAAVAESAGEPAPGFLAPTASSAPVGVSATPTLNPSSPAVAVATGAVARSAQGLVANDAGAPSSPGAVAVATVGGGAPAASSPSAGLSPVVTAGLLGGVVYLLLRIFGKHKSA